jgi:MSHA biogenesis protein MshQ
VGQISLNANKSVTPFGTATPVTLTGSSNAYVVAPHHFGLSAVTAGPIKAGNPFSATVTAYNGLATPTVTKNFGQETAPGPENVTLSFTKCQPTGINSSAGSFSGSVGAFVSGIATASNLNWSEVGNGDIVAALASGSYLASGLTATGNTGTGGTVCGGAGNVGRFIPDHFDTLTSGGITCPAGVTCPCPVGSTCPPSANNGFVYSGQPFITNIYARNASGATTVNYDGTASTSPNFAKAVTLTAWNATGSTTTQNPPAGTPGSLYAPVTAASFSKGTTALGTPVQSIYTFGTNPTAATNIYLRATDTDGVSSLRVPASASIENGITIVSGRLQITNAYGSELLPLPVRVTVQLWDATLGWKTSTTDSATTLNATTLNSSNWTNLLPVNWQKLTPASSWGAGSTSVTPATASVSFINGAGSFTLAAPGANNTGSVDMSIPAVTGASCLVASVPLGCYLPSNTARAAFGLYKNNDNFIYLRENF